MALFKNCRQSAQGATLVELAVAMFLMVIMTIAVSNLVRAGVEAQFNQRANESMQMIAMAIMDDIRFDAQRAASNAGNPPINVSNGGNTLQILVQDVDNGGTEVVTYRLLGNGDFERQDEQGTKVYTDMTARGPELAVTCRNDANNVIACFQIATEDTDGDGQPNTQRVIVPGLRVEMANPPQDIISANFGPPDFRVEEASFDIVAATQFK